MQIMQYLIAAVAMLASTTLAQTEASITPTPTDGASPSQSTIFRDGLSAYLLSLRSEPQFTGLAIGLRLAIPGDVFSSITATPEKLIPVPTGSDFDLESFATDPPIPFPTLDWESYLSTNQVLQTSVDQLRTSAVLELASSAQYVLGTSVSIEAAESTSSSTGGAAPALPTAGVPGPAMLVSMAGAAAVGAVAIAL